MNLFLLLDNYENNEYYEKKYEHGFGTISEMISRCVTSLRIWLIRSISSQLITIIGGGTVLESWFLLRNVYAVDWASGPLDNFFPTLFESSLTAYGPFVVWNGPLPFWAPRWMSICLDAFFDTLVETRMPA